MEKNILAIIPARGGSKRLPGKNIKQLAGKPLIAYTIEAALNSKLINKVVVSTDCEDISETSKQFGAEVIKRPENLAKDTSPTIDAIKHTIQQLAHSNYHPDIVLLLQPTSPLRTTEDINNALNQFLNNHTESLISVSESNPYWTLKQENNKTIPTFDWQKFKLRKQDLPKSFSPNGAIYISTPENIEKNNGFYTENLAIYEMPQERSIDIDEQSDFNYAEFLINKATTMNKSATNTTNSNNNTLQIGNKSIGKDCPCFIIAEIGVNHILEQEDMQKINCTSPLEVAYKMIDTVKEAGADAVKFQSFNTDKLLLKGTKKPQYQIENTGDDQEINYYDLLKKLETSKEDQTKISNYCKEKGIIFFSTPYDNDSADFLDKEINTPLFKLASIELNNHLFIKYIAKKGKPFLLSTGLSTIENVRDVIKIARNEGFINNLILLQCTSNYPTLPGDIHLNVLKSYQEEFPDILTGFSDHSPTDTASIGAVALGATVLEKHFTLDKTFKGPDHSSSLNPEELKQWVSKIREIEKSKGNKTKILTDVEKNNISMRKFLVIKPQTQGTIITEDSLTTMRTGTGILPTENNLKKITGKILKIDITQHEPFTWEMID